MITRLFGTIFRVVQILAKTLGSENTPRDYHFSATSFSANQIRWSRPLHTAAEVQDIGMIFFNDWFMMNFQTILPLHPAGGNYEISLPGDWDDGAARHLYPDGSRWKRQVNIIAPLAGKKALWICEGNRDSHAKQNEAVGGFEDGFMGSI